MRKRFVSFLICIMIVPVELFTSIREVKSQLNMPFIYYYSHANKQFIVESTDGIQSRVLTSFTLPDDCFTYDNCNIDGPGWSPSGIWFAWTVKNNSLKSQNYSPAMIVRYDGSDSHNILGQQGMVRSLKWSPTEDTLLIERYSSQMDSSLEYILWMGSSKETKLIFKSTHTYSHIEWSPTGKYLVAYTADDSWSNSKFDIISTDTGATVEYSASPFGEQGHTDACLPQLRNDMDQILYLDRSNGLVMLDISNSRKSDVLVSPAKFVLKADWRANSSLILYTSDECLANYSSESSASIWLLSLSTNVFKKITEVRRFGFFDSSIYFYQSTLASKNGSFVVVIDNSLTSLTQLKLINMASKQYTVVSTFRWDGFYTPQYIRWTTDTQLLYLELENGKIAVKRYQLDSTLSQTIIKYPTAVDAQYSFSVSPSGRYIAFGSFNCQGACVTSIETGQTNILKTSSNVPDESFTAEETVWSENEEWLFLLGNRVGDGRWLNIARYNGEKLRDLGGWYRLVPSSFGWMPAPNHLAK